MPQDSSQQHTAVLPAPTPGESRDAADAAGTATIPAPVLPADATLVVPGTRVVTTGGAADEATAGGADAAAEAHPSPLPGSAQPRPTPPWALRAGAQPPSPSSGARKIAPVPAVGPQRFRSLGHAGRRRSGLLVAALSVLTLGVYALIWHQRTNIEMADFDTRMHVRPARSTIAVVIPWLLGVLISVAGAARIILDQLRVALPFDPHVTVTQAYGLLGGLLLIPYLVLLLPFSAVAMVMTLERVRVVEDRIGRTTDVQLRPTQLVCWLLVPVIGGLVVLVQVQQRLNRVWEQAQQPAAEARISHV